MSIQITVTDPANTPRAELALVINFLQRFADTPVGASAPLPPAATLDPDDSPDVGLPVSTPTQAFGDAGAAAAFGAPGNVPVVGSAATTAPMSSSVPPAAPSVPSAAGAPATAGAVETDTGGLPWDARIHAGTRRKNADGTWTAKRGTAPEEVAAVTAQLRQLMGIPAGTVGNVTPPPPAATIPTTAATAPATIPTAPAGAPLPPNPPATAATGIDFPILAKTVGELIPSGRLSQDKLAEICKGFGVDNFSLLYNRPDIVPFVHSAIMAAAQV